MRKIDYGFIKMRYDITDIKKILTHMMTQKNNYLLENMDSPKAQDPETLFLYTNKAPPLEGGNDMKICGMWNLKHDIRSPKFYELLIKT